VIYIPADAERAEHAFAGHGAVMVKPFRPEKLAAEVKRFEHLDDTAWYRGWSPRS
jgi:hypothetical protein